MNVRTKLCLRCRAPLRVRGVSHTARINRDAAMTERATQRAQQPRRTRARGRPERPQKAKAPSPYGGACRVNEILGVAPQEERLLQSTRTDPGSVIT